MNKGAVKGATKGATKRRALRLGCIFRNTRTGGFYWKGRPPGASKIAYIPLRAHGKTSATRAKDIALVLAKRLVDSMTGQHDTAGPISRTIDAFHAQVATRSATSADDYRSTVRRFIKSAGVMAAWQITFQQIQEYLSGLAQDRSPSTVHRHKVGLSRFCRFCRRAGLMEHNPVADVETPRKYNPPPRYLTADQVDALIASAQKTRPELVAPIRLCLACGLRLTEMRRVKSGDFRGGQLLIGSELATKTYQWRKVTVPADMEAMMPQVDGPLFPTWDKATWINYMREVTHGLPVFGQLKARSVGNQWHLLRATWAVNRAREGWSVWRLMSEGGWTSMQTVLRYVNLVRASE